MSNHNLNL